MIKHLILPNNTNHFKLQQLKTINLKIMKKLLSILTIVSLSLFTSCSNGDNSIDEANASMNNSSSSITMRAASETLSYQDAVNLGHQHNVGLNNILSKLKSNTDPNVTAEDIVRNAVEESKTKEILNGDFQINFDVENPSLELLLSKTENEVLKNIYTETLDEINTSASVSDFNSFCDSKIAFIEKSLRGDEKFMAQAFIEVSRNSFQYWAPREIGGTGDGQEFLQYTPDVSSKKINWRNVIRNDGLGLGAAFIGNSIALAFGPMGGAAYVAGLAWGTISSSAFGGF